LQPGLDRRPADRLVGDVGQLLRHCPDGRCDWLLNRVGALGQGEQIRPFVPFQVLVPTRPLQEGVGLIVPAPSDDCLGAWSRTPRRRGPSTGQKGPVRRRSLPSWPDGEAWWAPGLEAC
jgi:hypothetical protein